MTSLTSIGVAGYARAVRDALRDLSPEQSHSILDGLDEHLAEIVAEGASDLVAVLGPPTAYAAELRASAGLPTMGPDPALEDDVHGGPQVDSEGLRRAPSEPIADDAGDEAASGADETPSTSAPETGLDHRVVAARAIVIAVLGVLAIISIRASDPISAWKVVLGTAVVGAAWMGLRFVGGRAALPEPWASRLPIGLASAAVVFALLLGGWLAGSSTGSSTEYAYLDVPMTSLALQFGETGVVQLPDVTGLQYQDAVQVLAEVGLGVRIDGDATNLSTDMTVVDMSPGPGDGVAAGSVITLRVNSVVPESTTFVTVVPQTAVPTTLAPVATTESPAPQSTVAAPTTSPPTTTLPPEPTAPTGG